MTLFGRCPTLAVWSVLHPLSQHYAARTMDVYLHISRFVGEDYSDSAARAMLRERFHSAARALGLPIHGNSGDLTSLFFAPLGPARAAR